MIIVKLPFCVEQLTLAELNRFARLPEFFVFGQRFSAEGGSPVSNDGRGLKHDVLQLSAKKARGSPVSNDGRGLKLVNLDQLVRQAWVRPSAMTGVD